MNTKQRILAFCILAASILVSGCGSTLGIGTPATGSNWGWEITVNKVHKEATLEDGLHNITTPKTDFVFLVLEVTVSNFDSSQLHQEFPTNSIILITENGESLAVNYIGTYQGSNKSPSSYFETRTLVSKEFGFFDEETNTFDKQTGAMAWVFTIDENETDQSFTLRFLDLPVIQDLKISQD